MLPYFFDATITEQATTITLTEETSKHAVQVLRMTEGEKMKLTNGLGLVLEVEIIAAHKKHCSVTVTNKTIVPAPSTHNTIAIGLVKNASRFEWFLEKASELGIRSIIPLITKRTEKQNFKKERMEQIVISAMLQSQQAHLSTLHEPIKYEQFIKQETISNKMIAHCVEDSAKENITNYKTKSNIVLIGPEGDFTTDEIAFALQQGFKPITLGATRLRTETAAVAAATLLQLQ